jgi:protoporphyrinogen oxidase
MDSATGAFRLVNTANRGPFKVARIGDGPGGMLTAWRLAAKPGPTCRIRLSESDSSGKKFQTGQFAGDISTCRTATVFGSGLRSSVDAGRPKTLPLLQEKHC